MSKFHLSNLVCLLITEFPEYISYWKTCHLILENEITSHEEIGTFTAYLVDLMKDQKTHDLKRAFYFIEFLLKNGDQATKDLIATGLLEDLLHKDPHEIQFKNFVELLGPETIAYCKGWDEFTGVKTKGLWD